MASFLNGLGPLLGLPTVLVGPKLTLEDKALVVGRLVGKLVGVDLSVVIALEEKLQEAETEQGCDVTETIDGNEVEVVGDDGCDDGVELKEHADEMLDPDSDDAIEAGDLGVKSGIGISVESTQGATSMR